MRNSWRCGETPGCCWTFVLIGTGEKLWINFAPKYLQVLGAGILIIGIFDALQVFLGRIRAGG